MTGLKLHLAVVAVSLLQITSAQGGCEISPKPDFSAPSRRLSEEKCLEYNWERKKFAKCSEDAASTKYSYLGLVGFKGEENTEWVFACLGTLISPDFVMTASHCIRVPFSSSKQSGPEIVRFSNSEVNTMVPAVDAKVISTIAHPEYKPPKRYYDIALVKIEKVILSKFVLPACLWSQPLVDADEYVAPGVASKNLEVAGQAPLTELRLRVLDEKACETAASLLYNRNWQQIQDHQFCANESFTSERKCLGSGGGPVVKLVTLDGSEDQMPYTFGVSSFGSRQCEGIGIYTRVSSFLDWIENAVW